jgi:hypothetical protein
MNSHRFLRIKIISVYVILFLHITFHGWSQTVSFDDSRADTIIISNGTDYELGISKTNGAILYITDIKASVKLTSGSLDQCLWTAINSAYAGSFSTDFNSGTKQFSYEWDQNANSLILSYTAETGTNDGISASVALVAYTEPYFDMQITVQNLWEKPLMGLSFPNSLAFDLGADDKVLVPVNYPGVMLESNFFTLNTDYCDIYPGTFHTDYLGFGIGSGRLCMYTLIKNQPFRSVNLGLKHIEGESEYGTHVAWHDYNQLWIEKDNYWTSPVSRIWIGESFISTLKECRTDKGVDLQPSLQDKFGEQFDDFSKSPVFCYAFGQSTGKKFVELADWTANHPSPSIAMLSMYYAGGFEGYHPDYLPPDPTWGTTEEFQQMVTDIKQQGKMVMPFTLPNWWNEDSPTLLGLSGVTLEDIAELDMGGNPRFHNWGSHNGYFVSPGNTFVINRVQKIYEDIFGTYGCDLMYEDVIGCHDAGLDFNPSLPTPMDKMDSWMDILRSNSQYNISVEGGSDRMVEVAFGFMGTLYPGSPLGPYGHSEYEPGSRIWRPFPTAPVLYHDKVVPMQFWSYSTVSKDILSWNLLFGCQLNMWIDDGVPERSTDSPWLPVVRDFQKYVTSRQTGKIMTDYEDITEFISKSIFEDVTVIRNGDTVNTYSAGAHTLPSEGVLVTTEDGTLIAGIFAGFNDNALSEGDHYLIIEKNDTMISVRQSMGDDTPIRILRPAGWDDQSLITVKGITDDGNIVVSRGIDANYISFNLNHFVDGNNITYYEILYDTGIQTDIINTIEESIKLYQNHPNPFIGQTNIRYVLPNQGFVQLGVFNVFGQKIDILKNEIQTKGEHNIQWDAKNQPEGIYFLKLQFGKSVVVKKIILTR